MELANEYVRLFYFSSRKTTLVIALTVTLFLSISAFTFNKSPPNPFEGILGENVTLEWNFTLTSAETFHYFALFEDGRYDMIIYTESKGASTYDSYTGRVTLARNGTPSFTLINLTSGNDGKEYCLKVSTQLKEDSAKTHIDCTRLEILVRSAIMSISKNQTVNETNDVKLTCTATGTPKPNVTWSKAGKENNTLSSNSFFTMMNISREQDGLYWCTADNGLNKAVASTRISVQYAPSITVSSKRYNITEGNDVHLECNVSDGRPSPTVTWSKIDGLSNITYPPGERLAIKNANRAEAGTYKCTADNGIGKPATATIDVDVFYAPSIDFQSKSFNVSEGKDVHLKCVSDGRPLPTVTWSKIGGRSNVTYPPGQQLTIRSAHRTEHGTYMCTASNGIGRQVTATIDVNVFYAPSIIQSSKRYNVTEGDDMHLECITNGRPSPIVTWSNNDKLSNITYPPGQRLTIKNSNRTEAGTYTCTASNGIGKPATATMVVNVFYPPSIERAPNNQTLNETQDLRLQCFATGNPQPFITWSKLRPNPDRIDSVDGVLIVNNVNKTISGVYQCRASNGIGSDTIALSTVTVNYKPRDPNLTSNVTRNTVIEGIPVTFTCSADSAPSPLYELRFKGVSLGNSSDGVFTIQKVRASDQGIYDCVPRNILGIGQMATLSLTVLVPPLIEFVSHNATANETDDVMLFCNATGNPRPNITWKLLNGPEKSVIRIGENHTLTNVTRNQAGTYQCRATNNVLDTKTANVYVVINYKPEIKDGVSREILSWINKETEVRCEAKGVPLPDISWSHGGEVTSFAQNKSRVSTFKFTPKKQKDFRSYECTASNLLGSTKQKTTIVMLVKPQAPIILRIEPGFDYLKIHWKASVTNSAALVLDYLVQVQEKHEPQGWKNCTQISKSLMCTINDLKSNTVYVVRAAGRNVVGYSEFTVTETQTLTTDEEGGHKVKPQAPIILRIERGFDYLKIHWKASVTKSAAPVLDYLVQVQEKHEPEGWRNCTQISKSLMCTISDLKSNTVYVVRVAGRNVVGYSEFTIKETQTLATKEEGEPKDKIGKTEKQQQALPGYTVDAIIGGVIGFTGLVVVIVVILSEKLKCRQGQLTINEGESPKVEATGHANKAFEENPVNDLEAEEEV